MSDRRHAPKAPKAIVEQIEEAAASEMPSSDEGVGGATTSPMEDPMPEAHGFQHATAGFFEGVGRAVWAYVDKHPHATLYGLVGLVLAVLILLIGLWDTIVIAVFVGVGTVIGQMVDGDNALVNCLRRWLDGLK